MNTGQDVSLLKIIFYSWGERKDYFSSWIRTDTSLAYFLTNLSTESFIPYSELFYTYPYHHAYGRDVYAKLSVYVYIRMCMYVYII